MDKLHTTIRATVEQYAMLSAFGDGIPVVLMVSGGSDSSALARLLPELYPHNNYTILHINHQLRGDQADADERFVVALAAELRLPVEIRRVDVAAEAQRTGENIEALGHRLRYTLAAELLDAQCLQAHVTPERGRIAVAHTRDERVETYLMRVIKGGGVGALASIPFVNGRVIRPLMNCSRAQLQDCLRRSAPRMGSTDESGDTLEIVNGSAEQTRLGDAVSADLWCEDASNADTDHLRAFVRHEVIPLLTTRNPRLTETIARSLDNLAAEDACLDAQAHELIERFVRIDRIPPEPIATIDTALLAHDPVLVRRVLHYACSQVMPPDARITAEHLHSIATEGARVGFATDIPGDVTVRTVCATLIIRRKAAADQPNQQPKRQADEGTDTGSEGHTRPLY
ncbi:MAG: tRNA lysidine(34) synthetase TilS [Coriobacteriales bacterium]|jgi:tRNA(Ile)-lysidine synthase|nr:tRNA lysidine(34) synthetase TilS [Coriobacteriales bacterium]